jgi:hypothetical protein
MTSEPLSAPVNQGLSREAAEGSRIGECSMNPGSTFIIGALVVALAVLGYFYYQRTKNDVTIQLPNVEIKP